MATGHGARPHSDIHAQPVPSESVIVQYIRPLRLSIISFLAPHKSAYTAVKNSILRNGVVVAVCYTTAAALVNHIRRIFLPWLGQFVWWHAVENMRLARGSPHFFLEETLDMNHFVYFWGVLQSLLVFTLRRWLLRILTRDASLRSWNKVAAEAESESGSGSVSENKNLTPIGRPLREELLDLCLVLYLALCMGDVERAFTQTCWAASCIYTAFYIGTHGTVAQRAFTLHALKHESGRVKLALQVLLLLRWALEVITPLRRHGWLNVALSPLPVVWVFMVAATAHVVKYSNKYFIWLEMSEMLATWAWMAVGVVFVSTWTLKERWMATSDTSS